MKSLTLSVLTLMMLTPTLGFTGEVQYQDTYLENLYVKSIAFVAADASPEECAENLRISDDDKGLKVTSCVVNLPLAKAAVTEVVSEPTFKHVFQEKYFQMRENWLLLSEVVRSSKEMITYVKVGEQICVQKFKIELQSSGEHGEKDLFEKMQLSFSMACKGERPSDAEIVGAFSKATQVVQQKGLSFGVLTPNPIDAVPSVLKLMRRRYSVDKAACLSSAGFNWGTYVCEFTSQKLKKEFAVDLGGGWISMPMSTSMATVSISEDATFEGKPFTSVDGVPLSVHFKTDGFSYGVEIGPKDMDMAWDWKNTAALQDILGRFIDSHPFADAFMIKE